MTEQIIIAPDPRLRVIADPVVNIADEQDLIDRLVEMMHASDGVGLAATQVGVNKRIIVMDVDELGAYDDGDVTVIKHGKFVMVNPRIINRRGKAVWQEGCLSVPGFSEDITRDAIITVAYQGRDGDQHVVVAGGLLSACIQHEIDHLDGVLFIDRVSAIKRDIITRKLKKLRRKGVMVVKPTHGSTL
jgi:peptide deformylase